MTLPAPSPAASRVPFLTPAEVIARQPVSRTNTEAQPRRRPTPQQGIALEMLGHAIEYLVDTNFYHQRADDPAVQQAISILKQRNRDVFAAAPKVIPARARAANWLRSRWQHPSHRPAVQTTSVPV